MNQDLKHRLIGAIVITALAAIFVPMLFDDPVDDTGQAISEVTVPAVPDETTVADRQKVPSSVEQVMAEPEPIMESYEEEEMTAASEVTENDKLNREQPVDSAGTGIVEEEAEQAPAQANDKMSKEPDILPPNSLVEPAADPITPDKPVSPKVVDEAKNPLPKSKGDVKKSEPAMVRWYLQAGSFSHKDNAMALLETLKKQNLPVELETAHGSNGTLYRLKVGPELSRKRAAELKAKLQKQKINAMLFSE